MHHEGALVEPRRQARRSKQLHQREGEPDHEQERREEEKQGRCDGHRGGADGWVALGVHSELPVWVGRPRATVEPAGAAVAVELAGTLVGPANHSRVAADADASLLVRARCRPGAATGRAVVHVSAPVERGGYEALRFSLAKVCGMSRRVVGGPSRVTQ